MILEQKAGISTQCSTHADVNIISILRVGWLRLKIHQYHSNQNNAMFVIIISPPWLPHTETCWLAAVLTVRHMWDTLATGIRWRWSWCLYVQAVCNMSLRDINVSQCWEGQHTQHTRSDHNPMFPQQRFPHILHISQHCRQNGGEIWYYNRARMVEISVGGGK